VENTELDQLEYTATYCQKAVYIISEADITQHHYEIGEYVMIIDLFFL